MKRCTLLSILGLCFLSCEDYLERDFLTSYSTTSVYQTEQDIRLALNTQYRSLRGFNTAQGNPRRSEYIYANLTDDSYDRGGRGSNLDITASQGIVVDDYIYRYNAIRQINEFLFRSEQAKPNIDPALFERYMAEARLIRAIHYARMNFAYHEVPLIEEPTDPDFFPKRATRLRLFNWIKDEFDAVATVLPESYEDSGDALRLTRGVALTLKARHLLNAIDWHPDLPSLYAEARAASQSVYTSGVYKLDGGSDGFQKIFDRRSANGGSSGAILTINYDRDFRPHQFPNTALPKGAFSGTKRNNGNFNGITSSLVEAYQMLANGMDIHNSNSGYDPANPWAGRDPRLDVTILRAGEVIPRKGGDGVNDVYTYDGHPKVKPENGVTTDDVSKNGINKTGYHWQKYQVFDFITPTRGDMHYHFVRFAETILLYAEAVLGESGDIELASSLVDEVRARVGLPDVASSYNGGVPISDKQQILDIIILERRLEFATEGPQRWFDLIRHKLAEEVFADPNVYGIPLGKNRKADANVNEGDLDNSKKVIAGSRDSFDPSLYYKWPLPQGSVDSNPNLLEPPE